MPLDTDLEGGRDELLPAMAYDAKAGAYRTTARNSLNPVRGICSPYSVRLHVCITPLEYESHTHPVVAQQRKPMRASRNNFHHHMRLCGSHAAASFIHTPIFDTQVCKQKHVHNKNYPHTLMEAKVRRHHASQIDNLHTHGIRA